MIIPLVNLRAQYESIQDEIDAAFRRVVKQTAFIGGDEVRQFENEFAAYCGVAKCVGVGNGTDALYLTLRAMGIGLGDEVITVAHTFIATAEAITLAGARPVFVDIRSDTWVMDADKLTAAITPRTRAIVPVHLYGQPCDMTAILNVARQYGLKVIEDAAQAHGARWQNRPTGSLGDAACFSFYPGKNLGAYGDGGAVVSNDEDLICRVRMLANHGRLEKYTHQLPGINSRLDGLQAAILRVKLRHLDDWNEARRRHAAHYVAVLHDSNIGLPAVHPDAESAWHLFVVRVPERERLQRRLKDQGIETGVHYPLPLHLQPAYQQLGIRAGTLPMTEHAAEQVVSLPMYAELTEQQVADIGQMVLEAVWL